MRDFQQFQEEANKKRTLDDRRKEAFERSREQLRKASQKPERAKPKAVETKRIKSKSPSINVARSVASAVKKGAKAAFRAMRNR